MIKVTLEFKGVDEAIVALGKLVGVKVSAAPAQEPKNAADGQYVPPAAPAAAEPRTRKQRADKGQQRGAYGPRTNANASSASEAGAAGEPATVGIKGTDPSKAGDQPAVSTSTTAPAAPAPIQPAKLPGPKIEDVQAALTALYDTKGHDISAMVLSRFGVKRAKDLLPEQWAEFIAKAKAVTAGEAP